MTTSLIGPQVSIGVPVYNGERFLEQTVNSLLAQSYRDFCILICDNASTDETPAICKRLAACDPRVRYFRSVTNLGADGNFRRVVELAQTPYFKLANADDLCASDLLHSCVEVLDREPEVVLCFGKSKLIDADGEEIRSYDDDLHLRSQNVVERFESVIHRIRMTNALQGVMRTALVKELIPRFGGYDGSDVVLLAAMALYGQFHEIPRPLFFRRMHNTSFTAIADPEKRQQYIDPTKSNVISAYLTRIYCGYFREVGAARLGWRLKLRLAGKLLGSLLSVRREYGREVFGVAYTLLRRIFSG